MTFNRYARRIDPNQAIIVEALRAAGAYVYLMALPVDLLVGYRGKTALVEIKDPRTDYGKKGLNANQRKFQSEWTGGTLAMIDSVESALSLLRMMA
jgi:hypothetical protein